MTAFAVDFRADRLVVCSDTRIYGEAGDTYGYLPKIHVLPRLRAVLFARGKAAITMRTMCALLTSPGVHTIEQAAESLPEIQRAAVDGWADEIGWTKDRTGWLFQEGILTGWSEAEQRMRAFGYCSMNGFETNTAFDRNYGGVYAWPPLPANTMPLDRSVDPLPEKLKAVLRAIDQYCVDNVAIVGGARLGGEMTMCTVTEKTIEQRVIGTFPDFDELTKGEEPPADRKRAEKQRQQRQARKQTRKRR